MQSKYFEIIYQNIKTTESESWQSNDSWKWNVNSFESLLHKFYMPAEGKLLELGCGDGKTAIFFAEKGYETYGVDFSKTAIELAKKKQLEKIY